MKTDLKQPRLLSSKEERIVFAMQLLGDKTRYQMFKLLMTDQQLCVSEIATKLGVTNSAISQHFRSFEMIGLVGKVRLGQRICYALKADDQITRQLIELVNVTT